MSMPIGSAEEPSNNRHACAACRHQKKKCDDNCPMAPYFPADMVENFQAVHRFFGISNVIKILRTLDVQHREDAAKSLIWEASIWRQYPAHGPLGQYRKLEQELELLRKQLSQQNVFPAVTGTDLTGLNQWNSTSSEQSEVGMLPNYEGAMNSGFTGSLQGGQEIESRGAVFCTVIPYTRDGPAVHAYFSQEREGEKQRRVGLPYLPIPSRQPVMPVPLPGSHGDNASCNDELLQGKERARQGRSQASCWDMITENKGNNGSGGLETIFIQGGGSFGIAQPVFGPSMGQGQPRRN